LERERVTVQQAAARLGITESAVRKRVRKGDIRSEKVLEGNRERLYVFLDPDAEPFPEPFREKYMRSLEGRVKTLEDEVMRQQAIILSMSQSLRALTGAPEAPQGVEEAQKEAETSPPSTGGAESRLGMSAWALAVGAIITLPTWFFSAADVYSEIILITATLPGEPPFPFPLPDFFRPWSLVLPVLVLPVLAPLLSGLWAGSTKRPSLPWFSSPHRWLRRGGRSVVEIATFTIGVPAWLALLVFGATVRGYSTYTDFAVFAFFTALVAFALASLAFMSGALLGNALRRVGLLGTPKEPPQGEEEVDQEEVWSPRKQAQWGIAGSIIAALISAAASVVAAALGQ
jgi:hypothetical protein